MGGTVNAVPESAGEIAGLVRMPEATRLRVLAKAASALADPVRVQILELLGSRGEMSVGELTRALPVSQPRVSVHLGCLTGCGYTESRREGRRTFYRIARPEVMELLERLTAHAAGSATGILGCVPRALAGEVSGDDSCC